MNRNEKPVVTFAAILGWSDREDRGVRAFLSEVEGHPRLGSKAEVVTSLVRGIEYVNDEVAEIETLNTLYKRRAPEANIDVGALAAQEN